MRHTYEFQMRWADMDNLQQVDTVMAADYLQEARIDMFGAHENFLDGGELAAGAVVARHELDFVTPLAFRPTETARIESWITRIRAASFVVTSELVDVTPQGRTVYMRASTTGAPYDLATGALRRLTDREVSVLGTYLEPAEPRRPASRAGTPRHVHPIRVRWSDVDAFRHVNNVKYLEYFHDARVVYGMAMHEPGDVFGATAVVRTDVDFRRPILYRRAAYEIHSWISHVGVKSYTVASEVRDGEEMLARAQVVMAGFDRATGLAEPLTADHRLRLLQQLHEPALSS
ncbi:MAG: thioesterase superfamily protein [Marmoricola sp.]|nr:thioesterase superfamily protein [Marmoricola sp.]